jgi:hypothetical protein
MSVAHPYDGICQMAAAAACNRPIPNAQDTILVACDDQLPLRILAGTRHMRREVAGGAGCDAEVAGGGRRGRGHGGSRVERKTVVSTLL